MWLHSENPTVGSTEWTARIYETVGVPSQGQLSVKGAAGVWQPKLLEEWQDEIPCENGYMSLDLTAFEILTLRIRDSYAPEVAVSGVSFEDNCSTWAIDYPSMTSGRLNGNYRGWL
jgi:hypothetical protein